MSTDPTQHLFWLSSRAFGVVALVLVSLSVGVGLALAGRMSRRPGLPAQLKRAHESLALAGLIAIVIHGLLLLGDSYLRPGAGRDDGAVRAREQAVLDRARDHRRLADRGDRGQLLRPALDRREGLALAAPLDVRRLRLGIVHTLGSGTDARSAWLLALVALTAAPIALLGALRLWPPAPRPAPPRPARGRALAGAAAGPGRPQS